MPDMARQPIKTPLPGMALHPIIAAAMPPLNGFYRQAICSPTHPFTLSFFPFCRFLGFTRYRKQAIGYIPYIDTTLDMASNILTLLDSMIHSDARINIMHQI